MKYSLEKIILWLRQGTGSQQVSAFTIALSQILNNFGMFFTSENNDDNNCPKVSKGPSEALLFNAIKSDELFVRRQ